MPHKSKEQKRRKQEEAKRVEELRKKQESKQSKMSQHPNPLDPNLMKNTLSRTYAFDYLSELKGSGMKGIADETYTAQELDRAQNPYNIMQQLQQNDDFKRPKTDEEIAAEDPPPLKPLDPVEVEKTKDAPSAPRLSREEILRLGDDGSQEAKEAKEGELPIHSNEGFELAGMGLTVTDKINQSLNPETTKASDITAIQEGEAVKTGGGARPRTQFIPSRSTFTLTLRTKRNISGADLKKIMEILNPTEGHLAFANQVIANLDDIQRCKDSGEIHSLIDQGVQSHLAADPKGGAVGRTGREGTPHIVYKDGNEVGEIFGMGAFPYPVFKPRTEKWVDPMPYLKEEPETEQSYLSALQTPPIRNDGMNSYHDKNFRWPTEEKKKEKKDEVDFSIKKIGALKKPIPVSEFTSSKKDLEIYLKFNKLGVSQKLALRKIYGPSDLQKWRGYVEKAPFPVRAQAGERVLEYAKRKGIKNVEGATDGVLVY